MSEAVLDARAGQYLTPDRESVLYAEVPTATRTGRIAVPADDLMFGLLIGAGTPPCPFAFDLPRAQRAQYDAARVVAALWLLDRTPPSVPRDPYWWWWLPDGAAITAAYDALLSQPADEQRTRVAALRAAEVACDAGDRLALLTGERG